MTPQRLVIYLLPALSAVLLILSSYLFTGYCNYLGFVALIPLFIFTYKIRAVTSLHTCIGWSIVGMLFLGITSYVTLYQFHWLRDAYLFTHIVHVLFIPISLLGGLTFGIAGLLLKRFSSPSTILNIIEFSFVWVFVEWLLSSILLGFNYSLLAYAAVDTPLLPFASIGGAFGISYIIAIINGLLATPNKRTVYISILLAATVSSSLYVNTRYLNTGIDQTVEVTFSIIQLQNRSTGAFGDFRKGDFTFTELEDLVATANKQNPDFIAYPFSSFVGVISSSTEPVITFNKKAVVGNFDAFGAWEAAHVHKDTVFITWNNVLRERSFYNEYNFWKHGELIAYYQKRNLFPFMDYTPQWAQKISLFSTPFDITAAEQKDQAVIFDNLRIGNLICSEINIPLISSRDSHLANLFLSMGAKGMFEGSSASYVSLLNAQLRATETNRPIVRVDRLGPSAIIHNSGKILAQINYQEEGVLTTTFTFPQNPKKTLYAQFLTLLPW